MRNAQKNLYLDSKNRDIPPLAELQPPHIAGPLALMGERLHIISFF